MSPINTLPCLHIINLMKLIHPEGPCIQNEMREYLDFALEIRCRVKEQLKWMDGRLRVAATKHVLFPTENSCDFAVLPPEVIDKLQIEFYSDLGRVAYKALAE
ncbi:MAG: hypothetical protein IPM53_29970 [Anaerolineaceae bacterium]|nr:hypothetical protein [Anaerolineaceae bacterium]